MHHLVSCFTRADVDNAASILPHCKSLLNTVFAVFSGAGNTPQWSLVSCGLCAQEHDVAGMCRSPFLVIFAVLGLLKVLQKANASIMKQGQRINMLTLNQQGRGFENSVSRKASRNYL